MSGLAFAVQLLFFYPALESHICKERKQAHSKGENKSSFHFSSEMNQMPYPNPIELHVSFPPDFNGLWFWLLAPMKGPELSVLGWRGALDRQLPELFSAPGTARLLRRLGLGMGPSARPFRGYCLLSLPRHSGSSRAAFSATIRSTWASGSSKSCPTASLRRRARRAVSRPVVLPSLHSPERWDRIFCSVGCESWGLAPVTHLCTPVSSSHMSASWLSCLSPLWCPPCWLQLVSKKK